MKIIEIRPEVFGFSDLRVKNRLTSALDGIGKVLIDDLQSIDFRYCEVLRVTFYASGIMELDDDCVGDASKEIGIGRTTGIIDRHVPELSDEDILNILATNMVEAVNLFIKEILNIDYDNELMLSRVREKDYFFLFSDSIETVKSNSDKKLTIFQKVIFGKYTFRFIRKIGNVEGFVDLLDMPIVYGNEVVQNDDTPIWKKMKYLKIGDWLNENELEVSYGDDFFVYCILSNSINPKK